MSAVGLLVRAELRRRRVALVLIGLLVGLIGATVVAGVAGARRTDTAYDRLAERTGQPDASIVSFVDPGFLEEVVALPEVEEVWRMRGVIGEAVDEPDVTFLAVVSGPPRPAGLFEPLMVEGRLPADDAAGEVAVAEGLAEQTGIEVGDEVTLGMLTQEEFESFDEGFGDPDGPRVELEAVGVFSLAGNDDNEQVGILGSPAFYELAGDGGGGDGAMVRLVDEPGADERFATGVVAAAEAFDLPEEAVELGAYDLTLASETRDRSRSSATVVARGLLLASLAGLVVGLLGIVQTVARHQSRRVGSDAALAALGLDRRQRVLAALGPFAIVAAPVAATVTVVGAVALSPLLPVGSARGFEPAPGVEVNVIVVAAGALLMAVLLLLVVAAVAARGVRRRPPGQPAGGSRFGWSIRAGLPFPVAVGSGLALDRTRSGSTAPVRAAMAGGVVAVAAVVGAAAFGASLARVVDTPTRYGTPGDVLVTDAQDELIDAAVADPEVDAVLESWGFNLLVEGALRDGVSSEVRKGSIGFSYLEGRPPAGPAELALGPALAERLDVGVGDEVRMGEDEQPATVTGIVLARADTGARYADSVVVADEVRRSVASGGGYREALLRYEDGVDIDSQAESLAVELEVERVQPPPRIRDIAQIRNLPLIFAAAAALLGVALLSHALAVTVRRRGHDLALMRALGARPRETVQSVLVMTVLIVGIGVAIGVPVGILAGNLAWRAVAASLYVAGDLAVPVLVAIACIPVALLVGVAASAVPLRRAGRLEVADQLRRE